MAAFSLRNIIIAVVLAKAFHNLANAPTARPFICALTNGLVACPTFQYSGHVSPGWEPLVEEIKINFEQGYEIGNIMTVMHKGKTVVDITCGYEDNAFTTKYKKDTIQLSFSSTKVWTAIAMAMLVDRELLSYDEPVALYWPEFAQNGKEKVTVGDLMSHAGGVHGVSKPIDLEVMLRDQSNHENTELSDILAATEMDKRTWRQNGGSQGYHGVTRGLYANEIMKRVDPKHRDLNQFMQEEIVEPMGLDFRIGLLGVDESVRKRVGNMYEQPWWKVYFGFIPRMLIPRHIWSPMFSDIFLSADEVQFFLNFPTEGTVANKAFMKVWGNGLPGEADAPAAIVDYKKKNGWQNTISGSTHGFFKSDSVARMGQVMVNGGTDPITGTKLMSPETVKQASKLFPIGNDNCMGIPISYSQGGFGLAHNGAKQVPWANVGYDDFELGNKCFGWGGAGGSIFEWCPDQELSFGYVMNYYAPHILDWRAPAYLKRAYIIAQGMK